MCAAKKVRFCLLAQLQCEALGSSLGVTIEWGMISVMPVRDTTLLMAESFHCWRYRKLICTSKCINVDGWNGSITWSMANRDCMSPLGLSLSISPSPVCPDKRINLLTRPVQWSTAVDLMKAPDTFALQMEREPAD